MRNEEEYTTVEHDFQQMKNFQKTLKFIFLEKIAKIKMIEAIKTKSWQADDILCEKIKNELNEVKAKNSAMDAEFAQISVDLANEERSIYEVERINQEMIKQLEVKEQLIRELISKDEINREKSYFINLKNSQKNEIEALIHEIEKIDTVEIKPLIEKCDLFKKRRDSLSRKQKRHSLVVYEDALKECNQWYKTLSTFIEEMFSVKTELCDDVLKINFNSYEYSFYIKNNRFVSMKGHRDEKIDKIEKYCIENNNLGLLINYLLTRYLN
ncbi:hypothetical protein DMUE_1983 [Dictyocoela muelleri]|nr:hypothetical protein DMUE_1983 [Dictyocoela muelleri]